MLSEQTSVTKLRPLGRDPEVLRRKLQEEKVEFVKKTPASSIYNSAVWNQPPTTKLSSKSKSRAVSLQALRTGKRTVVSFCATSTDSLKREGVDLIKIPAESSLGVVTQAAGNVGR